MDSKKATKNIRGHLLLRDLTIEEFAEKNHFNKWSVYKAIQNWWGKESLPRGGSKAFQIISLLRGYCHNTYAVPPEK